MSLLTLWATSMCLPFFPFPHARPCPCPRPRPCPCPLPPASLCHRGTCANSPRCTRHPPNPPFKTSPSPPIPSRRRKKKRFRFFPSQLTHHHLLTTIHATQLPQHSFSRPLRNKASRQPAVFSSPSTTVEQLLQLVDCALSPARRFSPAKR